MKKQIEMGMNRSGVQMSPLQAKEMNQGLSPAGPFNTDVISSAAADDIRRQYFQESQGLLGTVPLPGTVKGALKTGAQKLSGVNVEVLVDKLGARLAFERTGVRLYEALLRKYDLDPDPAVSRQELVRFMNEEMRHYELVKNAMESVGADPTAVTPSADLDGVAAVGLAQVLDDPRTTFAQSLHAIHIAELADNDGWSALSGLARLAGLEEWAQRFDGALAEEAQHLIAVRAWMTKIVETQAQTRLQ